MLDLVGNPKTVFSCQAQINYGTHSKPLSCSAKTKIYPANIGINHGFQCSNIRWITQKVFEHKAAGRLFKPLLSDPALTNDVG